MAGSKDHIQAVIDADIIAPLVQLLQNAEFDIKKEAAWAISNLPLVVLMIKSSIFSAELSSMLDYLFGNRYLVVQGCIKPLCDLVYPYPRIVTICLEGLENILKVGEAEKVCNTGGVNLYAQLIEDAEGLEKIENLKSHDTKAVKILKTYWLEEDDESLPLGDAAAQSRLCFGGNDAAAQSGFCFGGNDAAAQSGFCFCGNDAAPQSRFRFGGNELQVPLGGFNFSR